MQPVVGSTIGSYRIVEKLGEGGMGEVYHAHDTKLNRGVAIKVLLASVASDPERLARFSREAQVLASLNHPNIAHIHGLEHGDVGPFLVMELVDGPTLADRIARGALSLDEALPIARQIAEALEAAHERGIVHRDLKPANIKVNADGTVKVLDFGLAKAVEGAGAEGFANSPTITTPAMMTGAGIILGTAAYMSPEQAKGRPVDRRTDVWAFACVLYEMLTGRRAFDGEDVTDTIAAIVRGEPDWNALPAETPSQIRLLLKRCLEKDRRLRVADISVARFLMTETIEPAAPLAAPQGVVPPIPRRRLVRTASLGAIGGALIVAAIAWTIAALRPEPHGQSTRFTLTADAAQALAIQGGDHDMAFSPDGSHLVYRAGTRRNAPAQLFVRIVNDLEPRPLADTIGARSPFVSPDGRWVGFFAGGELRKISITGGPAVSICKIDGAPRGASWGDDDAIVFALSQRGLQIVPAGGGEPKPLTSPETAKGQAHLFPFVLPGSQAVLFTASMGSVDSQRVDVLDRKSGQVKNLIGGGHDAAYVDSGHLVFAVAASASGGPRIAGSLRAVRFDLKRLEVTSDQVPAVDQVLGLTTGAAEFALSARGDLAYVPGDPRLLPVAQARSLVWVNRRGNEEDLHSPERPYAIARISPDGTRVALDVREQGGDIWIWDLNRQTLTPLNRDPGQDMSPVWVANGARILWTSTRASTTPNLFWQLSNGTGPIERLTTGGTNQFPTSVSPDGSRVVLFGAGSSSSGIDLMTVNLQASDHKAEPLVASPGNDFDGEISPDGRWLAYHSNESGEFQVYVRPFPEVDKGRWQISTSGGTRAAWARSGRELFYLDENGLLTSVAVATKGEAFSAGAPVRLLNKRYYAGSSLLGLDLRAYDVAPDGGRFLMIKDRAPNEPQPETPPTIVVVLNWAEELKARLPTK